MAAKRSKGLRLRLVLEPAESACRALEGWLNGQFEGSSTLVSSGPELGVVLATASGRDRERIEPLVEAVEELVPVVASFRLGARLRGLPSLRQARVFVLSAECRGRQALAAALSPVIPLPGLGLGMGQWTRPHVVAARTMPGEDGKIPVARRTDPLPSDLRGPFDAVRLSLYCSQITLEGKQHFPLAQVELPVEAAVR